MKLNIGCGDRPKKGYVNIDLFNEQAHQIMDACDLRFDDNSAKSIEMTHVIEHLGFIRGSVAVSEAYRVLKDGGKLIIETPEIEMTFKEYLETHNKNRKAELLNWVYGLEFHGYQHIFCFPKELLVEMLEGIGFEVKGISDRIYQGFPSYRILAVKKYSRKKQETAHLRKKESKKLKLKNLHDYITSVKQEKKRW